MNETWIKLHSKLMNWEWYKDSNTKDVFIHCLLKANWKDGNFKGEFIPRGSFVTGRKKLSEELGLTEQKIKTALNHLKSTNEITIKTTNRFSIISINNYEKYQINNQQINQQLTNNQPTTNQQLTTIEEYKNNRILDINYIYTYALENFGRSLSPIEVKLIKKWFEEIDDKRKIIYAIDETILNRVNSFKYTEAILEKIKNRTYEELKENPKEEEPDLDIPDYDWLNENT